ncbi:ABC transporter permease [Coraliomargarita akajimensis]|uniref:Binding-protein-dependent transport systems inner membrane component n=1 Tax=Coraliomargarita akajimensis (strain DSM 45221 / IAM 15411 / JCM 23193 / KCTC 12865 / 04OKA010-24) TaxID=583355 RepID=D5EJS9_CORAD|nr:ABC transporter permease [Coraliomargarita akajimensis]ADE54678.1 binding-protein-dependent transport systems inner membrane component [Coraliomargarita akajimensis DSM 45221]
MLTLIARRFLQAIPTLWVIATATFVLLRLAPGGPFDDEKPVPPEVKEQIEAHYGLNLPLHQQYLRYFDHVLQGDLGPSYRYPGWDVQEILIQTFPASLELGCWALLVAIFVGIPLGTLAAIRHNKPSETGLMAVAMIGICLPSFVVGPLLLLVFSINLGWFNPLGWNFAADRVLPAITLGLLYAAYIARLARGGMLDVLKQDYIRTARAKGLAERVVILRHALRTALYPVVAYLGPAAAGLISGSFVVETIFFIPGMGPFFVNAALNRDYQMVMGTVLFYATLIILFNLIVDMLQMWMNPRTRHD